MEQQSQIKLMKQITDLKQGDKIYDIDFRKVKWYTYFCVHPHTKNYHILIDACEEPIRIYKDKLEIILSQCFNSYNDALLTLANRMEEDSARIKKEIEQKTK